MQDADWETIAKTVPYLERGSHKLQLMSKRKNMTVTEMQAQVGVLQKWLADIEEALGGKAKKVAAKRG